METLAQTDAPARRSTSRAQASDELNPNPCSSLLVLPPQAPPVDKTPGRSDKLARPGGEATVSFFATSGQNDQKRIATYGLWGVLSFDQGEKNDIVPYPMSLAQAKAGGAG